MYIYELLLLAVGLSMDALAISICKGLSMKKIQIKNLFIVGAYFGFFQFIMPVIGYSVGSQFAKYITAFDHWIVFILLSFIGGKMIKESFSKDEIDKDSEVDLGINTMFPLAVATSIDALAVGISFAFLDVNIWTASVSIGLITFTFSIFGVIIGNIFGMKFKSKAEFGGGLILIFMGIKILVEHLFFN